MPDDKKNKLIILAGPTAVGKTNLSIRLAKQIGGSVISADSMQVYRGMDIGTAKITAEEMQGIPHYLIDICEPAEEFNVHTFQRLAKEAMREVYACGRIPILTGGTGFYIQALLYDIDFTEEAGDLSYRESLEQLADAQGSKVLHAMLVAVDPEAAAQIHPHNRKRIIRALEFYENSGQRISEHNAQQRERSSPYDFRYFVLTDERERLYARIDKRVDAMLSAGLLEEVRSLRAAGLTKDMVSMQGLGYKELFRYLEGEYNYDEAVRVLKRDTRHFAKRQLTWFRRERDVIWINKADYGYDEDAILDAILNYI